MGLLIFDIVIFSLTLYKAFTFGRGPRLLDVIVQDGTMYFSILSIMNLGNILVLRVCQAARVVPISFVILILCLA
ncbi:hypothetical protein BGW80DRAFT_763202 [Lactifluus volemus]|nr:hypothetical protein BGW80DRAFT_763202 [Lactifluus volemus]